MEKRLAECQRVIGYHFADLNLLNVALTHSSLRSPDRECNERLEFLGDSVLGLVITEELYRQLPDQAEGELTRIKSAVVSRGALYRTSTNLGLARFAEFARGVGRRNELPVSVIANLVESIIGAIYLDAGFYPAREFVLRHLGPELDDTLHDRGAKNHKSLLQHGVQQSVGATPSYRMVDEGGPHHRKLFTTAALIRGQEWGRGSGATKKEAEQEAARKALDAWQRRGRGRRRRRGGKPPAESRVAERDVQERVRVDGADTPAADDGAGRRRRRRRPRETEAPAARTPAERQRRTRGTRGRAASPAVEREETRTVRKPAARGSRAARDTEDEAKEPSRRRRTRRRAQDDAPAPAVDSQPVDSQPVEEPAEVPASKPARATRRKPAKVAAEEPADAVAEKAVAEKPAKRPARASSRKPAKAPASPPDDAEPEAATPKAAKPRAAKPRAAKPEAAKPEAAKPEAAKPRAAKPKAAKPKAAKPKAAEPPSPGFSEGLDVPVAKSPAKKKARREPSQPARKVRARRKAPAPVEDAPAADGFDSGLD